MHRQREDDPFPLADGVLALRDCRLQVGDAVWRYRDLNADAIEETWIEALKGNPHYFNGRIHLFDAAHLAGDTLEASLLGTDYKSYLHWRRQGFPDAGVLDGFGSALIYSSDGRIILGRQRTGNVNGGLVYLPAGFIDERDVDAEGRIDIEAAVLREVIEETGIDRSVITRTEGLHLTRAGAQLSIAVPFRVAMTAAEIVALVRDLAARSPESELETIVPVAALRDLECLPLPHYTRPLLEAVLLGT